MAGVRPMSGAAAGGVGPGAASRTLRAGRFRGDEVVVLIAAGPFAVG